MTKYCHICGRELKKSAGPIGPKCLQKLRGLRGTRLSTAQYVKMAAKYDMYGDSNGQEKDEPTSKSSEK